MKIMDDINNVVTTTSDFQPNLITCPRGQEIYPPPTFDSDSSTPSASTKSEEFHHSIKYHQNPRKKRTKFIQIDNSGAVRSASASSSAVAKPKYGKKPDPSAPKITKPCSECGKKFWSWKALFGHMRCHPERQWRGINPPPNFRAQQAAMIASSSETSTDLEARMNAEDHEVAKCLLMLANGPTASESPTVTTACNVMSRGILAEPESESIGVCSPSGVNCSRFECSSCKKVFESHQALGGHRASHKNVKGCFAITRNEDIEEELVGNDRNHGEMEVMKIDGGDGKMMIMANGHKCSICSRVFSTGQALGGHKRCHWEKGDDPSGTIQALINPFTAKENCGLDLNLPAPVDDDSSSSYSSGLALDLRLGL